MSALLDVAREQQLRVIEGLVLAKNMAMLGLMSRLGFAIDADPDDATLRHVTIRLDT